MKLFIRIVFLYQLFLQTVVHVAVLHCIITSLVVLSAFVLPIGVPTPRGTYDNVFRNEPHNIAMDNGRYERRTMYMCTRHFG